MSTPDLLTDSECESEYDLLPLRPWGARLRAHAFHTVVVADPRGNLHFGRSLNQLPGDVLLRMLAFLPADEATRAACVARGWRMLVARAHS